jgi:hypothetical protein
MGATAAHKAPARKIAPASPWLMTARRLTDAPQFAAAQAARLDGKV